MTVTLDDILAKTTDLPSMPAAALGAIRESENPHATSQSIAAHILNDSALSSRILRLANSSFYGLSRNVGSISEAVTILGTKTVRNLCLIASTYPWLNKPYDGYELGPKALWRHSLAVATGSQLVADHCGITRGDSVFTAGLLHDLGKTVLSVWIEKKIQAMQLLAERDGVTFDEVERRVLGYDHCQVGAHLAERWNLPIGLVDVIRFHHQPSECPRRTPLLDCVHLGDYLSMAMGVGLGGDGLRYSFDEQALSNLGLAPSELELLAFEFVNNLEAQEKKLEGMNESN